MNLSEPITHLCGIRDSRERLLGVLPYAQRPQRGAIGDGKLCITAGGAKRNPRTMTVLQNRRPDRTRITFIADSATAPRLMPLGFIGFPYVAGNAALAVNAGLLILQPLARLCVGCHMLRMTSHLVSQFPFLRLSAASAQSARGRGVSRRNRGTRRGNNKI